MWPKWHAYETLRNNWCKISNIFSLYKKLHPGNLTLDTKNAALENVSPDGKLHAPELTHPWIIRSGGSGTRILPGIFGWCSGAKPCSENVPFVAGKSSQSKVSLVIEVWTWSYDVLLLKLKLRVATWLQDVFFTSLKKKILPKVPRKYEFNLKKSPPDGLHTTIPPRSSTCQQNVRSSQKFSTLAVWSFPERLKKIQVVTKEKTKCLQDADSSHGWAAELLKCS